ncbi:hypothetical protein TeGR_g13567 [Tetraparma gracilis]|jgi:hypothetical protein|uniref:Uncharacterized protein n=1 Tax=Tetraparma gracilis TaxID=2962635 RepID=A0ABQ6MT67_9STRA|nr:hypothetical protein TeGR_g13567 [Tetraparma gracilis]
MPVDNSVADCTSVFDALYNCATPVHQFKNLYLEGEYDSCGGQLADLKLCMRAKSKSDPEEARRIIEGYTTVVEKDMRSRENSPTDGKVWRLKRPHERGWG